ncbi:MAG: SPOR domain-containing protein [Spirosomataceae bacterium]
MQIYVGNIRKEADDARLYTYQAFPELNPYLIYNQPTYRVRIGDFMTRLEAERYLQQIRSRHEASVVVPEKIDLKKV